MFRFVKNHIHYFIVAGGLGAATVSVLPFTAGLSKFKEKMSNKSSIDKEVIYLVEKIKTDLKIVTSKSPLSQGRLIDLVQTDKVDTVSQGFLVTRWGMVLGVPKFFTSSSIIQAQENINDLQKIGIDLNNESGKEIFETFRLSEAAKQFALAREIYFATSPIVYLYPIAAGFPIVLTFILTRTISNLTLSTICFFSVLTAMTSILFKLCNYGHYLVDKDSVLKVASLSKEIALGGLEYYSAILKRQSLDFGPNESDKDILEIFYNKCWPKSRMSESEKYNYLKEIIQEKYGSN